MRKSSVEDYLRQLYTLHMRQQDKSKGIKSVELAKELSISKAGVSQMLKKLEGADFVRKNKYSGIFFTSLGLKKAKELMGNYYILSVFLQKTLKFKKNELDKELHALEHAFSKKAITRLDKFLGRPKEPANNIRC